MKHLMTALMNFGGAFMAAPADDAGGTGGSGGTGGEAKPPESAAPEPGLKDVLASIQQMNARLARNEEAMIAIAQGGKRGNEPDEDTSSQDDTEDPVQKRLAQLERAVASRTASLADQQDYMAYKSHVQEVGADAEVMKLADDIYANWRQNKVTISGQPPTRKDALRYAAGLQYEQQKAKARVENITAEQQRMLENTDAVLERGSRGSGGSTKLDPAKMTREERLSKYYPEALDKNGGF